MKELIIVFISAFTLGVLFNKYSQRHEIREARTVAAQLSCPKSEKIKMDVAQQDIPSKSIEESQVASTTEKSESFEEETSLQEQRQIAGNFELRSRVGRSDEVDYYFSSNTYTSYDEKFEKYFDYLDADEHQKRLASLRSANESGVVQREIVNKRVFAELKRLVAIEKEHADNPQDMNYIHDLLSFWRETDPEYVSEQLGEELEKETNNSNEYLEEIKRLAR